MKVKRYIEPVGEVSGKIHTRRLINGEKADFFAYKGKGIIGGKKTDMYFVAELKTGLNMTAHKTEQNAVWMSTNYMNLALRKFQTMAAFADQYRKDIAKKKAAASNAD